MGLPPNKTFLSPIKSSEVGPHSELPKVNHVILCSVQSQSEKDKCYIISLICTIKNKINKQNRNSLIDTEDRLTVVRGVGVGGWMKKRQRD